jgi:YcxB-like protein
MWFTIYAVVTNARANWRALGITWLIIGVFLVWAIINARRSISFNLAQHNAGSPDFFLVDEGGLHSESTNGATALQPWSIFRSWREGKAITLIFLAEGKFVQILPTTDLSPAERETFRGTLTSFLGSHAMR